MVAETILNQDLDMFTALEAQGPFGALLGHPSVYETVELSLCLVASRGLSRTVIELCCLRVAIFLCDCASAKQDATITAEVFTRPIKVHEGYMATGRKVNKIYPFSRGNDRGCSPVSTTLAESE